MSYQSPSSRTR